MGGNLSSRSGASRRGRGRLRPMSEINVTPFVDVMLVLLIVFMVTAPLLAVGVPVELPETRASDVLADEQPPLVITVQRDGVLSLQKVEMDTPTLLARLRAVIEENPEVEIYVRGDREVLYGEIVGVMDMIRAAGLSRVKLVTKLIDGA